MMPAGVNFNWAVQFFWASILSGTLPIGKLVESHQKLIVICPVGRVRRWG